MARISLGTDSVGHVATSHRHLTLIVVAERRVADGGHVRLQTIEPVIAVVFIALTLAAALRIRGQPIRDGHGARGRGRLHLGR